MLFIKKDKEEARYPIVAEENVKKASLMQIYMRMIKTLS